MPITLEDLVNQRQMQLDEAISRSRQATSDSAKLQILLSALAEIRSTIADSVSDKVTVTNLDEVKASIHNNLNRISKPVIQAINSLKIDSKKIEQIKNEINRKNKEALDSNYDFQVKLVKRRNERFKIDNLSDIIFPESVSINNLTDLEAYFSSLAKSIKETFSFEIPTPQVTVQPPEVNVPEIKIPETIINLDKIIKALDPLKFISDKPKKPISVRFSDGQKFLKTISAIIENQEKQLTAFSGNGLNESSVRKAFKQALQATLSGVGSKALADAATAVQITSTSTPCRYVDLSTNSGLANVGTSGAVQTSGSEVGVTIYPGNLPYRIYTDNVNKIYAAGATGTRLSWAYYV